MKFTINRNLFSEKLQTAQKVVASKSNMPALAGIYISCSEDEITLISSNGENAIKVIVNDSSLNIMDEGKCLVPGKTFCDYVKKFDGDEIDVELVEDNFLRIQSGASDATLPLLEIEDYPTLSFALSENPVKIKTSLLKEIIKETAFATSNLENKPILTGINLRISGNNLLAVATDSIRLSKRTAMLDDEYLETNIIIPARNMNEVLKIFLDDSGIIEMHVSINKILFKGEDILFQVKLLEGKYPETSKLFPTSFPIVLKFDKDDLISAIDLVSTQSTVVKMSVDVDGKTVLTSNAPESGNVKREITPLEHEVTQGIIIYFSANFFLDALKAFYSQEVNIKFNGEIKPFIIEADNDEGLIELVLPRNSE